MDDRPELLAITHTGHLGTVGGFCSMLRVAGSAPNIKAVSDFL